MNVRLMLVDGVFPPFDGGALDHHQPSYRPYRAPVLSPPPGSVPVSGREKGEPGSAWSIRSPPTRAVSPRGRRFSRSTAPCVMGEFGATRSGRPEALAPAAGPDRERCAFDDTLIFNAISFGFGRMPPFGNKLDRAERWSLVNFLRTRQ